MTEQTRTNRQMRPDPGFSRRRRALSGVAAGYLATGVATMVGLLITPIILRMLGREAFGVWAVLGQIVGYVALTDFGMRGTVQAHVARLVHKNDKAVLSEIMSTGLAIQIVLALLCLAVGAVLAPRLDLIVGKVSVEQSILIAAFVGAVLVRALTFPLEVFDQYLVAHQLLATSYLFGMFTNLLTSLSILGLLSLGLGLLAMPMASMIGLLGTFGITYWRVRRLSPDLHVGVQYCRSDCAKTLLGFSLWSFLGMVSAMVIYNTDNIVIARLIGIKEVTVYVLTRRLVEILRQNINKLNNTLRPGVADVLGRGDRALATRLFLVGMKANLGLALVGGILIGFVAPRFVRLWVGELNFGGSALVWISAAATVALSAFHFSSVLLLGELKVKTIALSRLAEAVLNLALSILFVKMGMGLIGVALGTLVACSLVSGWLIPASACRMLGIAAGEFASRVLLRASVVAAAVAGLCWLIGRVSLLSTESWISLGAYGCCTGLSALAIVVLFGLTAEERQRLVMNFRPTLRPADGAISHDSRGPL